jgi:hypothetical protein
LELAKKLIQIVYRIRRVWGWIILEVIGVNDVNM